ncbi:MAG: adenylate/guanylate cyclase domain-containing protein [Nitrospinae bacterium]|nr:adenylate/guanylate cyclase domain-containing protein [Nitrospinota bacterium]
MRASLHGPFFKTVLFGAIVLGSCALASLAGQTHLISGIEKKTLDWRMRFREPDPAFGKDVAVVLLDDPAMDQYPYRSPVPRDMLARIVDVLTEADARWVGLDVFLKDPSWEKEDGALADSLRKNGRTVVVSALRNRGGKKTVDLPGPKFLNAAVGVALADLPVDPVDQSVREIQLSYSAGPQTVASLSAALVLLDRRAKFSPSKTAVPNLPPDLFPEIGFGGGNRILINYQGPPSTAAAGKNPIKVFPASAALAGVLPKEWLAGKFVLIGAGYSDGADTHRTPFYSPQYGHALTPGVEIHANALATLLSAKTVRFPPAPLFFASLLFVAALALFLALRWHAIAAVPALLGLFFAYFALSFSVFEKTDLALPAVPFAATAVFSFVSATIYRSLTEGAQKRWIKKAFQMYLSPEFVEILVGQPDRLFLGGEEQELTILFTDLQGFTEISEQTSPAELVRLLGEYFEGMTQIVLRNGGTLDKFVGDSIVAFWNAPVKQEDHALKAAAAALEMLKFSENFNRRFSQGTKREIRTRIGINTGRVVVGNIGSKTRFNYTVIGDEANLASRLESANKQYGTYLMASESTYLKIKDAFRARPLDCLRVKGKRKPVKVYQLLGRIGETHGEEFEKLMDLFHNGLRAYQNREWDAAVQWFESALLVRNDDGPAKIYLERCRALRGNPPGDDWDGVYTLTSK